MAKGNTNWILIGGVGLVGVGIAMAAKGKKSTCGTEGDWCCEEGEPCKEGLECINDGCWPPGTTNPPPPGDGDEDEDENGNPTPEPECVDMTDCSGSDVCCDGVCKDCCDDGNCGECETCQNGTCVGCPTGQMCCDGNCQECCQMTDCPTPGDVCCDGDCQECCMDGNCGDCEKCVNGQCEYQCSGCQSCQGGSCVDDDNNCGPCKTCNNGTCGSGCGAGEICCDDPEECRECCDDVNCPTGRPFCTPEGNCVECEFDENCPNGYCCGNTCHECCDSGDCPTCEVCVGEDFCDLPGWNDCSENHPCPPGQECENCQCVEPPQDCDCGSEYENCGCTTAGDSYSPFGGWNPNSWSGGSSCLGDAPKYYAWNHHFNCGGPGNGKNANAIANEIELTVRLLMPVPFECNDNWWPDDIHGWFYQNDNNTQETNCVSDIESYQVTCVSNTVIEAKFNFNLPWCMCMGILGTKFEVGGVQAEVDRFMKVELRHNSCPSPGTAGTSEIPVRTGELSREGRIPII